MATRNHLEMCIIFLVRVNLQRIGVGDGACELPHRICGATGSLKIFKKIPLCHSVASGVKSKKVTGKYDGFGVDISLDGSRSTPLSKA